MCIWGIHEQPCKWISTFFAHPLHVAPMHADKYEDPAGLLLPPETEAFLDTWKRPEELVQNFPDVPMLRVKAGSAAAVDPKGAFRKIEEDKYWSSND